MRTLRLRADRALFAIVLAALTACAGESGSDAPSGERSPVVFVHGSGHSDASWNAMRRHLASHGHSRRRLIAVEIPPERSANDVAAREVIAPAVERALAGSDGKIDLVAHSMGAVSSRYFAAVLQPERVRTWIAIAGSNYGTNALCHSTLPGDRQMCPAFARSPQQGALQAQLNGVPDTPRDPTPYGLGRDAGAPSIAPDDARCIAYFTIRIEPDEWIEPVRSATIAGAGGIAIDVQGLPFIETEPGNVLLTEPAEHDSLPEHPHVIELVTRILAAVAHSAPAQCPALAIR